MKDEIMNLKAISETALGEFEEEKEKGEIESSAQKRFEKL